MQSQISEWVGGAFVHSHFRIENLTKSLGPDEISSEMSMYMNRYRDGSFSLEAITIYLEKIFGKRMLITDTQHPSYVLSEDYDDLEDADKVKFFNKEVLEETVDLLTRCIIERSRIIRKFNHLSHILTGAEVDILNSTGALTVSNEGLSDLDYVTASFHSSIFFAAGNNEPDTNSCMDMYGNVIENANVDAISHPTFYLPLNEKLKMSQSDWEELFRNMAQKKVAFEINLDSTNLVFSKGSRNLDRDLITHALKFGVPFVIGFDFHYMADWGGYPSPLLLLEQQDATDLFAQHCQNGSINKLLSRVLGNIYALKEMGIVPHDIMNSDEKLFTNWLTSRES